VTDELYQGLEQINVSLAPSMNDDWFPTRRAALAALAGTAVLPLVPGTATARPAPSPLVQHGGRDMPFNEDWLFRLGEGSGLEGPTLDDQGWRHVDLPHDWSIEDIRGRGTPFDKDAVGGGSTGYTVGGEGWYRKHFRLDGIAPDARVEIAFDGIYELADVWLNGTRVGGSVAGYSPFAINLTPWLHRGGDNILAVRVRNLGKNSRWYAGSGIYREVRLDILPPGPRIARWGVGAWTRRISAGAAELEISSRIEDPDPQLLLVTRLRDASGKIVAEATSPAQDRVRQVLSARGAQLWSPAHPYLHMLETEL
jgi:beta-galactosidase